jgi:choline-glycine betaine transporter
LLTFRNVAASVIVSSGATASLLASMSKGIQVLKEVNVIVRLVLLYIAVKNRLGDPSIYIRIYN